MVDSPYRSVTEVWRDRGEYFLFAARSVLSSLALSSCCVSSASISPIEPSRERLMRMIGAEPGPFSGRRAHRLGAAGGANDLQAARRAAKSKRCLCALLSQPDRRIHGARA